jgi:hypothetical protein
MSGTRTSFPLAMAKRIWAGNNRGMDANPYESPDDATVEKRSATPSSSNDDDERLDYGLAISKGTELAKVIALIWLGVLLVFGLLALVVWFPF